MTTHLQETVDQWAEDVDASGVYSGAAETPLADHVESIEKALRDGARMILENSDPSIGSMLIPNEIALAAWNTRTADELEAQLATARNDALEEAALLLMKMCIGDLNKPASTTDPLEVYDAIRALKEQSK